MHRLTSDKPSPAVQDSSFMEFVMQAVRDARDPAAIIESFALARQLWNVVLADAGEEVRTYGCYLVGPASVRPYQTNQQASTDTPPKLEYVVAIESANRIDVAVERMSAQLSRAFLWTVDAAAENQARLCRSTSKLEHVWECTARDVVAELSRDLCAIMHPAGYDRLCEEFPLPPSGDATEIGHRTSAIRVGAASVILCDYAPARCAYLLPNLQKPGASLVGTYAVDKMERGDAALSIRCAMGLLPSCSTRKLVF